MIGVQYPLDITRQTNTKGLKVKTTRETPTTHSYGRLLCFHCAKCGKNVVNCYETDPARGGGVHEDIHFCSKCGTALDFGEFYHKPKPPQEPTSASDEITFKE